MLKQYFKKFRYDVVSRIPFEIKDDGYELEGTFKELIASIDIDKQGYPEANLEPSQRSTMECIFTKLADGF